MGRIACLWAPRLPLVALLRVVPELRGCPVAIAGGRTPQSRIVAVSPEAEAAEVMGGMTVAQARMVCATLIVHPYTRDAVEASVSALADVAATVSDRVEVGTSGEVFLDCVGSRALCASEAELATRLVAYAARQGLAIWVGLGGSKLVARLAARAGRGVHIVPAGEERNYLAPLPIAFLDPDPPLAATLASWGVRRIGELAALPLAGVAHRLGPAGAQLVCRARGEDEDPLRCRPRPTTFNEGVELDYGVGQLDRLAFVIRRLLERLTSRLAFHGMACSECEIQLQMEGGGRERRRLTIAAPTRDGKVLLTLIRAHLEQHPPAHSVTGITLSATALRVCPAQLDLFRANGPAPTAWAEMVARLAALCGTERIGSPQVADTHRPDAVAMAPYRSPTTPAAKDREYREHRCAIPGDESPGVVIGTALRAFRPAVPLEVFESAGRLDYVRGSCLGGRVVHVAGPWRLRGEWWATDPYAREYYDLELSDGGLYRIYRDVRTGTWHADGVYD